MSLTTVTTLTNLTAPPSTLIKTSSMTFASPKGSPTVALSSEFEVMDKENINEKSLSHKRTLRPSDFDSEKPSQPTTTSVSPISQRISLQEYSYEGILNEERRVSRILHFPAGSGSIGASATTPISRLKRQKTLMPEDFKSLHQHCTAASKSFESDISRPESAPPQASLGYVASTSMARVPTRQGYVRIFLTPTIDDTTFDSRKISNGMKHFTVWESEAKDTYLIQGHLYVYAFQDQQHRPVENVYQIFDISLNIQTYSQNSGPYSKESEESPAYFDFYDTSGKRRRTNTLINILQNGANVRESSGRSKGPMPNLHSGGRTMPTSCVFTVGIPLHLFKSMRERYFRLTARATFEIGSRHPLSFSSTPGIFTHSPLKLVEAVSTPMDFTVSYLTLPLPCRQDACTTSYSPCPSFMNGTPVQ